MKSIAFDNIQLTTILRMAKIKLNRLLYGDRVCIGTQIYDSMPSDT